ncbi:MAG: twin-arginine translocase TatA/TatE family subunit [Chloroflexi bacterium]|nr:twin-arginine translocase TatA/TatE family subunit [Chloroflexota bacterium]
MDSLFGIGLPELLTIMLLAALVMGPQRIREVARTLGKWTAVVQQYARQFTRQLNAELDAMDTDDLRSMRDEVKQLQNQLTSLREDLRTSAREFAQESRQINREAKNTLDPRLADGNAAASPTSSLPKPVDVYEDPEV